MKEFTDALNDWIDDNEIEVWDIVVNHSDTVTEQDKSDDSICNTYTFTGDGFKIELVENLYKVVEENGMISTAEGDEGWYYSGSQKKLKEFLSDQNDF